MPTTVRRQTGGQVVAHASWITERDSAQTASAPHRRVVASERLTLVIERPGLSRRRTRKNEGQVVHNEGDNPRDGESERGEGVKSEPLEEVIILSMTYLQARA